MTHAHHPCCLAQPQALNEQTFEGIQLAAPKVADPAVVRLLIAGKHPESQILVAGTLDLRDDTVPTQ
jgi:hypothetical protein